MSRDGHAVAYEVIALRAADTLIGIKILRPTDREVLSDETLRTILNHLRIGPPADSE